MRSAIDAKTAKERATIAASLIKRGDIHCRAFDDCFEMFDGDEVFDALLVKIVQDAELARAVKDTMIDFATSHGASNS